MQSLVNLSTPRNTLTDLRAYCESHPRTVLSDSYGALLIPITLMKLPADVTGNLARQ